MKIIECPRDAMQGLHNFIPTETKISYINDLLKVGFDTIDFGSFVSPKAIPQLRDTADVVKQLDLNNTKTKLLAIIANLRGAQDAVAYNQITYLGFPFSVSETFQKRNTNSTMAESLDTVKQIQDLCLQKSKQLVLYISMGFGNPYADKWNTDIVLHWVEKMIKMEIKIISIADTVGVAAEKDIASIFKNLTQTFPDTEFGAHLHCRPDNWTSKVDAAFSNGCQRFDAAMKGFGGCPFAEDDLVGNLATENLLAFLHDKNISTGIDKALFNKVLLHASSVFA
ncbi:MAG: hydroxymethylglutaryl-CoA lyase [Bacteroidia bacterium]